MCRSVLFAAGLLFSAESWAQAPTTAPGASLPPPAEAAHPNASTAPGAPGRCADTNSPEVDGFNYVIGTQTFSASYHFTEETPLVETAQAIHDLGATVIKFGMYARYGRLHGNVPGRDPRIHSLTELARDEPSHRKVLDMPFANYVLWAHTFSGGGDASWREGLSERSQTREYRELYDFTCYLLKHYSGSGKTFYLGHWEGDGWLRGSARPEDDVNVTPQAVQGMVDWLNTRQRAVDDAKRDTPHSGVQVWHYTEVNHVKAAMEGRPALVNAVLPKTHVDFVSYSSYDTASDPAELKTALEFIESKLPRKPGIPGKRVWIGEYGFPAIKFSAADQDARSRRVMRVGLEWGCPFVLYWEMYNNEVDENGKQRGFWLIDDKGAKTPVYSTHQSLLEWGRRYVAEFEQHNGRVPTSEAYRAAALTFLDHRPAAAGR